MQTLLREGKAMLYSFLAQVTPLRTYLTAKSNI